MKKAIPFWTRGALVAALKRTRGLFIIVPGKGSNGGLRRRLSLTAAPERRAMYNSLMTVDPMAVSCFWREGMRTAEHLVYAMFEHDEWQATGLPLYVFSPGGRLLQPPKPREKKKAAPPRKRRPPKAKKARRARRA